MGMCEKHGLPKDSCAICKGEEQRNSLIPNSMEDLRGKTPEELTNLVSVLDAHLRDMHQDPTTGALRDLSESEQAAFDLGVQMRTYCLDKLEQHRQISEVFSRRPEQVRTAYDNIRRGIDPSNVGDIRRMTFAEARDKALRVMDTQHSLVGLEDYQLRNLEKQIRRNTDIARRVVVTENDAYRSAFVKLVTDPDAHMVLDEDERNAIRAYKEYKSVSERAMAEGAGSSGGYGLPVFIDPSIILTAQGTSNPFMQLARQVPVNTNAWKGVTSAGVSWSFQAEAAVVADNSPTLAQPVVNVNMARGFIPFSIEVGEDYPGFAEEVSTLLAAGYDELLINKFTTGSGTNEPMGLITYLSADTTDAVQVKVAASGSISVNDPYNAWKNLAQRYRRTASWMMSVGVNNAIRELGTANQYHATTVLLPDDWADTLMGKAVYENAYMADITSATGGVGQYVVVGDFSNYLIATRGGMSVELVPHLFDVSQSNRPTGQRGWFAYSRIGGGVVNGKGFTLLNQT